MKRKSIENYINDKRDTDFISRPVNIVLDFVRQDTKTVVIYPVKDSDHHDFTDEWKGSK